MSTSDHELEDRRGCCPVVIGHTVEDGTTLTGLDETIGGPVRNVLTRTGWFWSRSRGCWYLPWTRGCRRSQDTVTVDRTAILLEHHGYEVDNVAELMMIPQYQPVTAIINPDAIDPETTEVRRRLRRAKNLARVCSVGVVLLAGVIWWAFIQWGFGAVDRFFDQLGVPGENDPGAWHSGDALGGLFRVCCYLTAMSGWFIGTCSLVVGAQARIRRWIPKPPDYDTADAVSLTGIAPQWARRLCELEHARRKANLVAGDLNGIAYSIWGLAEKAHKGMELQAEVESIADQIGPRPTDCDSDVGRLSTSLVRARAALCEFNTAFNRASDDVLAELTGVITSARANSSVIRAARLLHVSDLDSLTSDLRDHIASLEQDEEGSHETS